MPARVQERWRQDRCGVTALGTYGVPPFTCHGCAPSDVCACVFACRRVRVCIYICLYMVLSACADVHMFVYGVSPCAGCICMWMVCRGVRACISVYGMLRCAKCICLCMLCHGVRGVYLCGWNCRGMRACVSVYGVSRCAGLYICVWCVAVCGPVYLYRVSRCRRLDSDGRPPSVAQTRPV